MNWYKFDACVECGEPATVSAPHGEPLCDRCGASYIHDDPRGESSGEERDIVCFVEP